MLAGEATGPGRSQRVRGLMSQAGGLVLEAEGSSRKSINLGLGCMVFRTVILEVKGRGVEWIETRREQMKVKPCPSRGPWGRGKRDGVQRHF